MKSLLFSSVPRLDRGRTPCSSAVVVLLGQAEGRHFHNGAHGAEIGSGGSFLSGGAGIAAAIQNERMNQTLAGRLGILPGGCYPPPPCDCYTPYPIPLPGPLSQGPGVPPGLDQLLPLLLMGGFGGLGQAGPLHYGGGNNLLLLLLLLMLMQQSPPCPLPLPRPLPPPILPPIPFPIPVQPPVVHPHRPKAFLMESDGQDVFGVIGDVDKQFGTRFLNATDRSAPLTPFKAAIYDESGKLLTLINLPNWQNFDVAGNPNVTWNGPTALWEGKKLNGNVNIYDQGSRTITVDGKTYDLLGVASVTPIILDLDGNGKPDVAGGDWKPHADKFDQRRAVMFDIRGDGRKVLTEWVGPKDGLLVYDQDGTMEDRLKAQGSLEVTGKELLGDEGGKYKDGYAKMRALGLDGGTGQITGDNLKKLKVWRDTNGNAVVDEGEISSAESLGISSIKTTHPGDFQSSFVRNGREEKTWDWWPSVIG